MNVKKILMADDDQEDIDLFKDVLADLGVELEMEVAGNGIELLKLLEKSEVLPDMIFLDLNMPLKNGMQCLQQVRVNQLWNDIKIIILSTSSHKDQVKAAYVKGADFYMVKSFNYIDFKNAVAACLQNNWQLPKNN